MDLGKIACGPTIRGIGTSQLHEDILDRIRWRADEYLYLFGYLVGDFTMSPGDGGCFAPYSAREMRPDVWVVSPKLLLSPIAVEIGSLSQKNKWLDICPMIHVGFTGGVILVNGCGGKFEDSVVKAIKCAIDPSEPDTRPLFWWRSAPSQVDLPSRSSNASVVLRRRVQGRR
jgi:hypothetical protein